MLSPLVLMDVFHRRGLKRREVPERFWFEARDRGDYAHAVVSCPCGRPVVAEVLAHPEPCEGCQRAYFYDGTAVWALNSPSGAAEA